MGSKRKVETAPLSGLSLAERKHTRFEDSSDEDDSREHRSGRLQSTPLRQSEAGENDTILRPRTAIVPDTSKNSYVIDLALSTAEDLLGSATGSRLTVHSLDSAGLKKASQSFCLEGSATAISFAGDSSNQLYACGTGGTLVCWDVRQKREAQRFIAAGKQLNCLDTSNDLVAAGTNGSVLFWDRRKASNDLAQRSTCLTEFSDTHEQEVTQVKFHPEEKVFLSGSEDGLISVFETNGSSSLDEDDGFQAALNLMDSVAAFGFYGEYQQHLWCRTFTENLYLWDWRAACSEDQQGGEGPFGAMRNGKDQLASVVHSQGRGSAPGYLLDCHFDAGRDQLLVAAGTDEGNAATYPLAVEDQQCLLQPPIYSMHSGHSAVIRKMLWTRAQASVSCISGGEDGKIVCWAAEAPQ